MNWRQERAERGVEPAIAAVSITQPTLLNDVRSFANSFDLILIDAGGRDNSLFRSAMTCGMYGMLLVPVVPSGPDIWATQDTMAILKEIRSIGIELSASVVLNSVKPGTILAGQAREAMDAVAEEGEADLLPLTIGDREVFRHTISTGTGVVEADPSGKAAAEIQELYKYLLRQLGEDEKQ